MISNNKCDQFVFGILIYRVPSLPLSELKRDMCTLKKLGFNTVKIQESWCIDEKREGEIDLNEVEELVAEAKQIGMGVYFGITMEQVLMWVWRKYPDCRMVNALGEPHEDPTQYLLPHDGKPGPCWDHPGVRHEAEHFMSSLAKTLGQYDNIVVWCPWQELDVAVPRPGAKTLAEKSYCYCPYTLAHFRRWLKEKYGSLEVLNSTWKTGFGYWDEVEPPRMFMMVPSWIDWRYFMNDVYLPGVVKWKGDVLRQNDPLHRPVIIHGGGEIGSGRAWSLAKGGEILGISHYPSGLRGGPWYYDFPKFGKSLTKEICLRHKLFDDSMKLDYRRGAVGDRQELWIAEFQGGRSGGFFPRAIPTPEDIRRWLIIALSSGVQGICFWNHRPEIFWSEMHSFGLCKWDGTPTERAEEAGRIGKALNRHGDLFRRARPPRAQVAIVINEDLYHFAEATPTALDHLQHTIWGWYQCLWEEGIWVDFVEVSEILQGALKPYKATILPFPIALADELAEVLRDYVAAGGTLISEACPGRVDKYGMANLPGMTAAMRDLFGAEHKSLVLCGEWGEPRWTPRERYYGEIIPATILHGKGAYEGYAPRANFLLETYTLTKGIPILTCKQGIVGIMNTYGQGRGVLLGTLMGHNISTYDHTESRSFMLKLVTDAQVKPQRCGNLLLRRRTTENQEIWFLINHSTDTVTECINLTGFIQVEDLLEEKALSIKENSVTITVEPFAIRCLVLSR